MLVEILNTSLLTVVTRKAISDIVVVLDNVPETSATGRFIVDTTYHENIASPVPRTISKKEKI